MTQKEQVLNSSLYKNLGKDYLIKIFQKILHDLENGLLCYICVEFQYFLNEEKVYTGVTSDKKEFIEIFRPPSAQPNEPRHGVTTPFWGSSLIGTQKRARVVRRIIKVLEQC